MPQPAVPPRPPLPDAGADAHATAAAMRPAPPLPDADRKAALPAPAVEPPSPDVALADDASPLPGAHRGGFLRLPTAPVAVVSQSAPAEPGTEEDPEPPAKWLMPPTEGPHRGLGAW